MVRLLSHFAPFAIEPKFACESLCGFWVPQLRFSRKMHEGTGSKIEVRPAFVSKDLACCAI